MITPTPWRHETFVGKPIRILAKNGPLDVSPATVHGMDDAAFIVKAVNNHEKLMLALQHMVDAYWGEEGDGGDPPSMIIKAWAALEAVKAVQ